MGEGCIVAASRDGKVGCEVGDEVLGWQKKKFKRLTALEIFGRCRGSLFFRSEGGVGSGICIKRLRLMHRFMEYTRSLFEYSRGQEKQLLFLVFLVESDS